MSNRPFDFSEARDAINAAKSAQAASETAVKDAYKELGEAERAYRKALAVKIVELRAAGQPVTIVQDLAKGDEAIADLRYERDVAEGAAEAAKSALWRHNANRKDLNELVQWSARRDLAEGYSGAQEPSWSGRSAA